MANSRPEIVVRRPHVRERRTVSLFGNVGRLNTFSDLLRRLAFHCQFASQFVVGQRG
jgi:hypothetical protein